MARRNDIDWEAIERHYRGGALSIREIGKQHGVSAPAILKRAKRDGWARDLTKKVRAAVNAQLVNDVVNAETKKRSERKAVEITATVIVMVVREHQTVISRARAIAERMVDELEKLVDTPKILAKVGVLKDLAIIYKTLIPLERQAFNIDAVPEPNSYEEMLDKALADAPGGIG